MDADGDRRQARWAALRSVILYGPFFLAACVGAIVAVLAIAGGGSGGAIAALVVTLAIAFLTGYQTIQSLRDALEREPRVLRGVLERTWSRADFILFRSYYVMVERQVFRVEPEDWGQLEKGDQVRVAYYPHANTLQNIERIRDGEAQA